jgi:hypothetical protein
MSTVEIDTEATSSAARSWVGWGDELYGAQLDLAGDLAELRLDGVGPTPCRHLAAAATDLWTTAVFAELVVERVATADVWGGVPVFDDATIDALMARAGSQVTAFTGFAPPGGDLAGTFGTEVRSPWLLAASSAGSHGRDLVSRALADTAANGQIRADEFEIVRMSDGRVLVILPGVTDLTSPGLGLGDRHRSVRDLDQHAYPSSRSTDVDDNRYAQMVIEALAVSGVAPGTELVLVGHSFGADTALDLAADDSFNGPDGYRVSHVVAAAYHSQPQLEHVPDSTRVLVLQNHRDVPVIVEGVGSAHVTEAIEARRDFVDAVVDFDLPGVLSSAGRAVYHDAGAAVAAVDHTIDRADDVADIVIGAGTGDLSRAIDGVTDFVTLEPSVSRPRPNQVVAVFEGGGAGAGHAQSNYIGFVQATDDPAVAEFLESLGGGTSDIGTAMSIDVSVPR